MGTGIDTATNIYIYICKNCKLNLKDTEFVQVLTIFTVFALVFLFS